MGKRQREPQILDASNRVNVQVLLDETNEVARLALQDFNTNHDPGLALEHAAEAITRLCNIVEILERRTAPT